MKKKFLYINVFCYLCIAAFLAATIGTSLKSGYPWAMTCYNCVLGRQICPLGIDPYGFISAAITNDPEIYVSATNIRMKLGKALDIDPNMTLILPDKSLVTAQTLSLTQKDLDYEVTTHKIKVKDAATFCPLCGNCDRVCPINLPVLKIIEDLKDDGKF
ncbi:MULTISPECIES: hypothetical protein [Desulfobacula]|uniref:Conserved uncharacterized protein n=2 Tax=Desulfobacula TaxID=28222 RepID=K0NI20_DESTT|nr:MULTISPECIES: hypothetical protein [Desulfobacula]CCK79458.1 conserved uncharacterized protein [Desulfobacula toluolica Tol2]SDT84349.1 hypothetical protein SAMN04487931_101211 [Desulfobacula phenolica]